MRVPFYMILGLLIAVLIMDITSIWMVRGKIIAAMDQALDAALVGGIMQADRSFGGIYVDESQGEGVARLYFSRAMALDSNLENKFLKGTTLQIEFQQNEERPVVQGKVATIIQAMTPKILGLEGVPVTIRKTVYHLEKYK